MQIDLIRHGEIEGKNTYCGRTDHLLTENGWQQMLDACEDKQHWQVIVTSPLIRCRKFSQYLAAKLNVPLEIDSRWQEMNFGDWDGLSSLEIMAFDEENLQNFWRNPYRHSPTNGESLKIVENRVLQAWNELVEADNSVLVIAHGGPIRIVNCHMQKHPIERLMEIDVPYATLKAFSSIPLPLIEKPKST